MAVVAALALLVVGGMALFNAVTGKPDDKGPSAAASPSDSAPPDDGGGGAPSPGSAESRAVFPLVIRVTGQPTTVVVRVADADGAVLTNELLRTGQTQQYKKAPLQVVASNGGSLQVVIYGKVQPAKPDGQRGQWFVRAR